MSSALFNLPPTPSTLGAVHSSHLFRDLGSSVPTHTEPIEPVSRLPEPNLEECNRFRVLQLHASGGQGEVFIARDVQLRRDVAVKELKARHANRPVSRTRFLREAEITGGLEHPGVVPVYALGKHPDGRPFYAMRLIEGRTMHEVVREFHRPEKPWTPAERNIRFRQLLQRFISVCQTIAFAHSRGIVHRDIKPSNVLIGAYGEAVVVDWGLARHYHEETGCSVDTDDPAFGSSDNDSRADSTQMGSALGTPAFMSPEQAAGQWDEVGPISDVYSLGATLYVLLSGHLPLKNLAWPEMSRRICKGDIPSPREVNCLVPRGLDAVCRKAMSVNPAQRYENVLELAKDVERWMADEPVAAAPAPFSERVRRWVRRHRMFVVSSGAVFFVLTIALGFGLIAVNHERNNTLSALEIAERRRKDQGEALEQLTSNVIDQWLGEQYALRPEHKKFLEKALADQQRFANETPSDLTGQLGVVKANRRVGEIQWKLGRTEEAAEALSRARSLFDRLQVPSYDFRFKFERAKLDTVQGSFDVKAGRITDAEHHYATARSIWEELVRISPNDIDITRQHVHSLSNHAVAMAQTRLTGDAAKARLAEAAETFRTVIEIWQRQLAAGSDPRDAIRELMRANNNLGKCLIRQCKRSDAEPCYRASIAYGEQLTQYGVTTTDELELCAAAGSKLGGLLIEQAEIGTRPDQLSIDQGKLLEASNWLLRAEAILARLLADNPSRVDYSIDLTLVRCNLGAAHFKLNRFEESSRRYEDALAIGSKLAHLSKSSPYVQQILTNVYHGYANALNAIGKHAESADCWTELLRFDPKQSLRWRSSRAMQYIRMDNRDLALCEINDIVSDKKCPANVLYNAACVLVEDGQFERAVVLLNRAKGLDFFKDAKTIDHMDTDSDLTPLRSHPGYLTFRESLNSQAQPPQK